MIALAVVCTVAVTLLITPETFVALSGNVIEHPIWGIGIMSIFLMVVGWISRQ